MVNQTELKKARDFLRRSGDDRAAYKKNHPEAYGDMIRLIEKVWHDWQLEWADECWIKDKRGMLKKNPGKKEHPFLPGVMIPYHQPSWELMRKVKRGTVKEQQEAMEDEPTSPVPIGQTQVVQDRLPYKDD